MYLPRWRPTKDVSSLLSDLTLIIDFNRSRHFRIFYINKNLKPQVIFSLLFSVSILCNLKALFFQAARETGALKEAKDKLEKKVEELTWRIQLEKRLRVILCCFNIKFENICHG